MHSSYSRIDTDVTIVGASFAGLACARALAQRGKQVTILERKMDVGEKLHTTGILVKEAAEQEDILQGMPPYLVRRIEGVRLYAPNLRHIDLSAPGYYFLATDTPNLMRWLANRARGEGVRIALGSGFNQVSATTEGWLLDGAGRIGRTSYLVGADGPASKVARQLNLGVNREFLTGVEYEYSVSSFDHGGRLHCFIDKHIAPGYIGWLVQGVHHTQVGIARRQGAGGLSATQAMTEFLEKISPIADFRETSPVSVRAGLIPCGGLVSPLARPRALLVGDAAGMVSPVTAGGIHTALKHGHAAGHAIADFLQDKSGDPCDEFTANYPRFRTKRALRWLFDHAQTDWAFNLFLNTPPLRWAAGKVYFHRKGVFTGK